MVKGDALRRLAPPFLLLLIALAFLALKSFSLHWEVGDENIYWYMAQAMAEDGVCFYRDFFFAHPPLHLLPGVVLVKIFGFSILLMRLLPAGAALLAGICIYLSTRRSFGAAAGALAAACFLFSFDVLRASSHWTGINLTVMWLAAGWWAFASGRCATAGLLFSLAAGTGNYALPSVLGAGVLALLEGKRSGLRFSLAFAGLWLTLQIVGLFLGGGGYIDAVWRYHLQKPEGSVASMFARVFTDNLFMPLCALLGVWFGWRRPEAGAATGEDRSWLRRFFDSRCVRGRTAQLALLVLLNLLFLSRLGRLFPFYFLLVFVWLAPLAGLGLVAAGERLLALGEKALRRNAPTRGEMLTALSAPLLLTLALLARGPLQNALLPDYVRKVDRPMVWADAPLLGPINTMLRLLFFENPARAYKTYGTITEYLFHESQYFEAAPQLAEYVSTHTQAEDRIFGDSSSAPLLAMLAGRRLAAHEADTNAMRFRSGITRPRELIEKVEKDRLKLVVVSGREEHLPGGIVRYRFAGFGAVGEFRRWLEENFEPAYRVRDRTKGEFFIFARRQP